MNVQNQPMLTFGGVDIQQISFNAKKPHLDKTIKIDFNIDTKYYCPEEAGGKFVIIMPVELKGEDFFSLSLVAFGNFQIINDVIDDEIKKNLINVNAPAIMFPYVRSFISFLTSQLGSSFKTITIPTQIFSGELDEYKPNDKSPDTIE